MAAQWRYCRQQYDRVLKLAETALAERLMLLFAVLESIIIPIPVDPLLIATVLARPAKWVRLTAGCTLATELMAGGRIAGAVLELQGEIAVVGLDNPGARLATTRDPDDNSITRED